MGMGSAVRPSFWDMAQGYATGNEDKIQDFYRQAHQNAIYDKLNPGAENVAMDSFTQAPYEGAANLVQQIRGYDLSPEQINAMDPEMRAEYLQAKHKYDTAAAMGLAVSPIDDPINPTSGLAIREAVKSPLTAYRGVKNFAKDPRLFKGPTAVPKVVRPVANAYAGAHAAKQKAMKDPKFWAVVSRAANKIPGGAKVLPHLAGATAAASKALPALAVGQQGYGMYKGMTDATTQQSSRDYANQATLGDYVGDALTSGRPGELIGTAHSDIKNFLADSAAEGNLSAPNPFSKGWRANYMDGMDQVVDSAMEGQMARDLYNTFGGNMDSVNAQALNEDVHNFQNNMLRNERAVNTEYANYLREAGMEPTAANIQRLRLAVDDETSDKRVGPFGGELQDYIETRKYTPQSFGERLTSGVRHSDHKADWNARRAEAEANLRGKLGGGYRYAQSVADAATAAGIDPYKLMPTKDVRNQLAQLAGYRGASGLKFDKDFFTKNKNIRTFSDMMNHYKPKPVPQKSIADIGKDWFKNNPSVETAR